MVNLSKASLKEKTTPQNMFVVYLGYLGPQALLETTAHLDHMAGLESQDEMAEKARREKRVRKEMQVLNIQTFKKISNYQNSLQTVAFSFSKLWTEQ